MVEAWNRQSGSGTFDVIFDGNVYRNHWEVEAKHCPGDVAAVPEGNPWRWLREATADEMTTIGNPTTCEPVATTDAAPAAAATTDSAPAEAATPAPAGSSDAAAAEEQPAASESSSKPAAAQ